MALFVKALVWQGAIWLLTALLLFFSAGRLSWPAGWIFFSLFFGFVLFLSLYLLRTNASLLNERLALLRRGQPVWDQIWVLCFYLLSLAWLSLMPLDAVRWQWSQIPLWAASVGLVLLLCALAGIFVTIRENRYLSPLVRLQFERGHTLVSTGPYAHLRHPLYTSAFLFYAGVPLLLGSWLGFACTPIFIGLLIMRAVLEERMLRHTLPGYDTYMKQVTRRFVPRIR
jgi:protein-S-isoprenylcysteine O-methyltransferase Ste14